MSSSPQRKDAIHVRKTEQGRELLRPHAALEAVADAGSSQPAGGQSLGETEQKAAAKQLRIEQRSIQCAASPGSEHDDFGMVTNVLEMTIDGGLDLSGEPNRPRGHLPSSTYPERNSRLRLRQFHVAARKSGDLGHQTTRSVDQRKRRIELDPLRLFRSEIDEPDAIGNSRKSRHSQDDLPQRAAHAHAVCVGGVRTERHRANRATGPPAICWMRSGPVSSGYPIASRLAFAGCASQERLRTVYRPVIR